MFGYLRFLLAFLVLLSHVGVRFAGLNPGVIAVVIFYLLAGFVVSHLYTEVFAHRPDRTRHFIKDRILRIFPLYLYVVAITALFLLITGYGHPQLTLANLLSNLTIIPLNYYMYHDPSILTHPKWWLIPPAWSLGAELQAYLLLVLLFPYRKLLLAVALLTFGIYQLANLSILHPDYYGYRLLAGVFFIFYLGTLLHRLTTKPASALNPIERHLPLLIWIVTLLLGGIFLYCHKFSPAYTKETFIGLLIGMPLILFIATSKIKLPFNHKLGALSYGLFLSHFFAIWLLAVWGVMENISLKYILQVTIIAVTVAYIGVTWVEEPISRVRLKKTQSV